MKTITINTQLTQKSLVQKEIQQLFKEYDHVKVENRGLRITWNFYKPQPVIQTKKEKLTKYENKTSIKNESKIANLQSEVQNASPKI